MENTSVSRTMDPKKREKAIVVTSSVGIGGNFLLVAFKLFVGILAHSVSILLDAVNNLTDALSSVLTIVGTKLSGRRPNRKHPFGYGRVEYLTSTVIALLILFAGFSSVYESVQSLIQKDVATYTMWSFILLSAAVVVKVALGLYFLSRGKKLSSEALKASGKDALLDSLLSVSTLIAALVTTYAHVSLEGYVGILIGLFILKSGLDTLKESLSPIVGDRAESALSLDIKRIVNEVPGVKGAYDLILNDYGNGKVIGSVHVEVRDDMTAREIQALERAIVGKVYLAHHVLLTVGIYASNDSDPESRSIKESLAKKTKDMANLLQVHGFYVDEKSKEVHFDLIFSFDEKDPEKKRDGLLDALSKEYPAYSFSATLDQDFSD